VGTECLCGDLDGGHIPRYLVQQTIVVEGVWGLGATGGTEPLHDWGLTRERLFPTHYMTSINIIIRYFNSALF